MEKPNRTAADSELAEARERIQALTGLLDAVAALADQPPPAVYRDPVAVVASESANDTIAIYARDAAEMTTAMLSDRTQTVAKKVAEPVPYAAEEVSPYGFGSVRAAYLARTGLPECGTAQPEAGQ